MRWTVTLVELPRMSIKETINSDLKKAMLAGDKPLVMTLRGLKSAILYAEVAAGNRDAGLSDTEVVALFSKEAKKRQESADLYQQGGNTEKANAELAEKRVIETYLPVQLSDDALRGVVSEVLRAMGGVTKETMGRVIAEVKIQAGPSADGARIAAMVKEKMT